MEGSGFMKAGRSSSNESCGGSATVGAGSRAMINDLQEVRGRCLCGGGENVKTAAEPR